MAAMDPGEKLLHLVLHDQALMEAVLGTEADNLEASGLDARTHAMVRLAALLALDAPAATYEWTFNNGNLNDAFLQGTMQAVGATVPNIIDTNGTTIPHIAGVQARVLSVPAFTDPADGFNLSLDSSGPNGLNGLFINQYTFIFDVYSPGVANWQAFFQTNPDNHALNRDRFGHIERCGKRVVSPRRHSGSKPDESTSEYSENSSFHNKTPLPNGLSDSE